MANCCCGWQESQLRKYDFPTEQLPRLSCTDKEADEYIKSSRPVVLTDTHLIEPALRWSLEYLREHIGDGQFTVYQSPNHMFKYYDDKKLPDCPDFKPPMRRLEMSFPEFCERLKIPQSERKRVYLQQGLNETVGPQIVRDFIDFNWTWVNNQQKANNWGPLTSNLLLISEEGDVTPCHYDEQENFYSQAVGYKRVILFPPEQFECLYTFPVYHPYDRQTQVNFDKPDYKRFPKFKNVRALEAVLGPGDVLYLPPYWFHHFETLLDSGIATAITFWYKSGPVGKITFPLKAHQKVAMTRNIEKMIGEALRDPAEMAPFFRSLVLGRYTADRRLPDEDE